jgi:uncharacterized protein
MEKEKDIVLKNMLSELNDIVPRYMASIVGTQFKNNRDMYQVFGWERVITSTHLYAMYKTNGLARAVNDTPVDTTWRYFPTITGNTAFNKELTALNKRLKLLNALKKADRLAGIGTYSIIVLNIAGQDISTPLKRFKLSQLKKLDVYADHEVGLENSIDKDGVRRYGIKNYRIGEANIHPSRVIHIAENSEDGICGQSRLYPVYNQLMDMWKITGSTAELYYITASLLLTAKAIDGFKVRRADATELQDSLLEVVNKMKGFLITSGFEIENIAPPITSPKDSFDVHEKFISSTSRIPRRILFGSEMGQLASSQDQTNYYEHIESRQRNYINTEVIGKLIDRIMIFSDLPTSDFEVSWHKLSALSDKEVAESIKEYSYSLKYMSESGVQIPDETTALIFEKINEMIRSG